MNTPVLRSTLRACANLRVAGIAGLCIVALSSLAPPPATAAPQEAARDGTMIAYDDATVLDSQTGLMWTRGDNGASIDWYAAQRYCAQLRHAGYADWRLPTAQELTTLFPPAKSKNQAQSTISKLLALTGTHLWSEKSLYEPALGTEPVANYLNTTKNGKLDIAPKHRAELSATDLKLWQNLRALAVRDTRPIQASKQSEPFGKRVDRFRSRAGALTTAKTLPIPLQQALSDGLLADDTRAAMRVTADTQLRAAATASIQRLLYPEWLPADASTLNIKSDTSSHREAASNWTAQWRQSGRWFQVTANRQKIHVFTELRDRVQVATPTEKALSAWSNAREVLQFSENARLSQYDATRGYALVGLAPRHDTGAEGMVVLTDGDIISASFPQKGANL